LLVSPNFDFEDEGPSRMPLVGRIAAGMPIEAIEDRQSLDLEQLFRSKADTFLLRVSGQSMIDDHIQDGDYVVCERREDAHNGEMVVALLDDGEATLKRFYREKGGRIRLQPANIAFKPIFLDDVRIQGVVVGVIRKV
jgi:repressor LexA